MKRQAVLGATVLTVGLTTLAVAAAGQERAAEGRWAARCNERMLNVRVSSRTFVVEPVYTFNKGVIDFGGCTSAPRHRQSIVCALDESWVDTWLIDQFNPEVPSTP